MATRGPPRALEMPQKAFINFCGILCQFDVKSIIILLKYHMMVKIYILRKYNIKVFLWPKRKMRKTKTEQVRN